MLRPHGSQSSYYKNPETICKNHRPVSDEIGHPKLALQGLHSVPGKNRVGVAISRQTLTPVTAKRHVVVQLMDSLDVLRVMTVLIL